MKLTKKFEIKSMQNIIHFLNIQKTGRLASIDIHGYPQIIPMNFVYIESKDLIDNKQYNQDAIYMHSSPFGEKLDNIKRNQNVGFEVDEYICFLPSYYFHPKDASQADTLYKSIVIKGNAFVVHDNNEKTVALNALMKKYQKEGMYEQLNPKMSSVREVSVIKIIPKDMKGKYKIGQHWFPNFRLHIAQNILQRENKEDAKNILNIMGIEISATGKLVIKKEPSL